MNSEISEGLDYFFKGKDSGPYWTDSSWFSWAIPEKDICGLVWTHFRPNMNCLCGGHAVFGHYIHDGRNTLRRNRR